MNMRVKEHNQVSDLLPLYVSGALEADQRVAVEQHLPGCAECQADLALWKTLSAEIVAGDEAVTAPRGLADRALAEIGRLSFPKAVDVSLAAKLKRIPQLLRSQMPLVHREIWPASALVIGLGYVAALVSEQSMFIYSLAPLVAAACVSLIYGPENDPAFELALSTPTSPRQILLARLALVFGYNLALVLVATLGLLPFITSQASGPLLGTLVLPWLAPMTFLTAVALALSLWIGASSAISVAYLAWLIHLLSGPLRSPVAGINLSPLVIDLLGTYQNFWQSSGLLLVLSALLFGVAVWLAGRSHQGLLNPA